MEPSFLVFGDTKAGSTSLHSYLSQHTDVFMPDMKELRYFAFDPDNSYHRRARSLWIRSYSDYLAQFSECGSAKAIGEASPNYLRTPGTAERVKRALPDAKLICSLRNPADRLYSLHQMDQRERRTKVAFDQRAFGEASLWIKGNFYWPDLNRWFQVFPRSQIKIILFEDLVGSPVTVTQSLYRFLGVDDAFVPEIEVHNPGGVPYSQLAYSTLIWSKNLARRFLPAHGALKKSWLAIKRRTLHSVPVDLALRRQILEVCREDIERTQDLIGRDLSFWLEDKRQ